MTELASHACQSSCAWAPTDEIRDGMSVFRCAGCASEWVRTEVWTPSDADGSVPAAVAAERAWA
ncbi:MAG TPA: hypothetical protein VGN54_00520 [Mycobacteriales bacterium]|nr:hypothetical protein [Mycobacteriales bacterium]